MTRSEFMHELAGRLGTLPPDEREQALRFYNEYFDEAGPGREQEIIEELGSPQKVAPQILANFAAQQVAVTPSQSTKKNLNFIWFILLGLLAAPIALPIALVVVAVLFSLIVSVLAVAFSLLVTIVVLVVVGFVLLGVGVWALFFEPATGVVLIGGSFIMISLFTVMGIGAFFIVRVLIRLIAKGCARLWSRIKGRKQK